MLLHEDIIRHMTVRVEALEEGPSAMMQSRGGRGGRGGRDRDDRDFGNRNDGSRPRQEPTSRNDTDGAVEVKQAASPESIEE
jgi:small subunit ribosomal protein S6